jgi:hypothetical protein
MMAYFPWEDYRRCRPNALLLVQTVAFSSWPPDCRHFAGKSRKRDTVAHFFVYKFLLFMNCLTIWTFLSRVPQLICQHFELICWSFLKAWVPEQVANYARDFKYLPIIEMRGMPNEGYRGRLSAPPPGGADTTRRSGAPESIN